VGRAGAVPSHVHPSIPRLAMLWLGSLLRKGQEGPKASRPGRCARVPCPLHSKQWFMRTYRYQWLLWVVVSSGDQSAQWSVVVVGGGQ
jgi:hypothetical protein